jgi:simple sugar transport system permease protein
MELSFLVVFMVSTLVLGTPLILAAMGGFLSERSGVINIALEGNMLIGACSCAMVSVVTGNALIGIAAGIGAATISSLLHWMLTQVYGIDAIISGMVVNIIAFGVTSTLSKSATDIMTGVMPSISVVAFVIPAYGIPFLFAYGLHRSKWGIWMISSGDSPSKARSMGLSPRRIRLFSLIGTGVVCGLAGCFLVNNAGQFVDGMTAGRGFIALAALILGGWRPLGSLFACVAFGFFAALQLHLQGTQIFGMNIPANYWATIPYVVTVIALAGFLGRSQAPRGLGKL